MTITTAVDFKVKVYRYGERMWSDGEMHPDFYDGWFVSKVYVIKEDTEEGVQFLVYDDGSMSSDEEYWGGFYWVVATATMWDIENTNVRKPMVELVDE